MTRFPLRRAPAAALVTTFLLLVMAGASATFEAQAKRRDREPDERLEAVLQRLDQAQEQIKTFRADVVETRELTLLAEPETLRGQLTFERPGLLRWEYDEPVRRVYVLSEGELVGWLPEKNRIEKLDVSRSKKRIERLLALGQGTDELTKDFRIEFVDDEDIVEGADQILLVPKSRRVRRRIQELRLWVSREHGLPRRIRYVTGEADATVTLEMTGFVINPQLSPGSFELEIPPEAEIVEGLTSLGLSPENATDAR